ncbi:MAG: SIMPL domain-containing protein [Gemmobacter sp.]
MRPLTGFVLVALVTLPIAAWSLPARADTPPLAALPQITVTGEGRVDAAPDLAMVTVGVTTHAATASEALDANSVALATVLANLRAAGIAERDLQTSGFSLNPVWSNYASDRAPRIEGFQAANILTARVRALDGLGKVLDAAVKDGANTLNGLTFGVDDPAPLMDAARQRAVADARRRAELLAGAAGVKLGRVLTITEGGQAAPGPMYRMEAAMVGDAVPVAQGEVTLGASVTVVWELIP